LIVEICLILRETGGRIILKFVGEGLGLVWNISFYHITLNIESLSIIIGLSFGVRMRLVRLCLGLLQVHW
jgi:hypothetical protein